MTYHLCEGDWYKVDDKFIARLQADLDAKYEDQPLPSYNHGTEGKYNEAVPIDNNSILCLDQTSIAPRGQKQIEPCDLYTVSNKKSVFYHVKISTLSHKLSHLFNQGVSSIVLIKSEAASKDKLKEIIQGKLNGNDETQFLAPIDAGVFKVIYAIITHKDKNKKSENLPLFSRISLIRSIKDLNLMEVEASYCFVKDEKIRKTGKKKKRKKKKNV